MFDVFHDVVSYSDRWDNISFAERLAKLRGGTCRVAYFYDIPDVSTFRYRVYNVVNVINAQLSKEYSASFFCEKDILYSEEILNKCDILVLCRVDYSNKINQLIAIARAKSIKIVFDVDDLVFDTSYTHLILNSLDKNLDDNKTWDYWFSYIARKGEVLKYCDFAITTNAFLAKQIQSFVQIPCYIIPNFFNNEQLEISKNIMEQKIANNFARKGEFCLGYFSGSSTHNLDFDLLSQSLIRLFNLYPNLILHIVGFIELKGALKSYSHRIKFHPFQDYVNLQCFIGMVDINLIPLQYNTFTNCKSELKYFESAICGTISIATPTHIYKKIIKDGVNGYLAQEFNWEQKIVSCMNNMDLYPSIAQEAYEYAVENYAWYKQDQKIKAVFDIIRAADTQ